MLKLAASLPGYEGIGNFKGEIDRYQTVNRGQVVHGHEGYTDRIAELLSQNDIKTILMIRDPRDQLISRVFHIRRDANHHWHEKFKNSSIDEGINLCIEGRQGLPSTRMMIDLTLSWLVEESDKVVVRYEELQEDARREFQIILEYLDIELSDNLLKSIIQRNQFERLSMGRKFWRYSRNPGQADPTSHYRKGIVGDWRNYLEETHIRKLKEVVGDKIIELGYESDSNW